MALKSAALFEKMDPFIKSQGAELVKKINAVYYFEVSKAKGETPEVWTVDLKNGTGAISKGKVGTADATFTMIDDDMIAMAQGKLNPQQAFMQGKMKIKGNMAAATKFTPDLLPKDAKL
ncbi:unnamed protein product (macronuclear) [Paramecium tetraurelia]|uniref:SCP2 domain-containing protein n=1 Tax=Paramecium tetraurelia TaxID=5888 RepID=A0EA54_PARTE|nr:uncharacterized protein GSPATT00024903001 [Paramecium tetraurelia]CAK92171.1 unnamed protein product [Paramecium tetraurelia]|eukprot:XP_001459568.1 hypothetical protein (macronuclear) [Paramecium tetraurelia strain d4-2]